MIKWGFTLNKTITLLILALLIVGPLGASVLADSSKINAYPFDKGVTWKPYVSMKRLTLVDFDEYTLLDDYAYLAAVPTSVFYDKNEQRIYTNPLLFFEEEHGSDSHKELSLNARQGIDYFLEDWMAYCNGYLDQMTLINVPKSKVNNDWNSRNTFQISGSNPYNLSQEIALHDWSYSDEVVVAVIEDSFDKPNNKTKGTLTGEVPVLNGLKTEHFEIPKTNEVYPIYNEFTVPDGYKFMKIRSWYPSFYIDAGIPGFEGAINASIPAGDRDLQIYCQYNGQWMMAGITNAWNAKEGMDFDKTTVYVYKSGKWSVALTDVPTKDFIPDSISDVEYLRKTGFEARKHRSIFTLGFGRYGNLLDVLKNLRKTMYQIDIEMYPGTIIEIPEEPPYGCRNVHFSLTWDDPFVDLGFSLIGPGGEEVLSTREAGVSSKCAISDHGEGIALPIDTETDMKLEGLGQVLSDEKYSLCVFTMNELKSPADFTVEYSWEQNFSKQRGDALASATEGAVLASVLNTPLLYTSATKIPPATRNTLLKLGVKNIHLIDLGGWLTSKTKKEFSDLVKKVDHHTDYTEIYSLIRDLTGENDIIFSTVDPWSYWYIAELEVAGEMPGGLYIGPAAYLAAQHGSPVILVDNHPELSSALVWHNELWQRHPDGFTKLPTVSEMYLTGTRIYDFLKRHGYDQEGEETIITIAGQFDIGLPWDRVFVGKAMPGRFIGSPTDISVWISKTVFYPQIVFENPALKNPNGVQLINGSSSKRRFPWRGKLGLKITKPSQEETFMYPVLDTLVCYDHKFNSRASKYWGFTYKTADGDIPGFTQSLEPIDEGVMLKVNGQEGGYFADMSGSEVQPFYLRKGGFDPVYSTNFNANMENLNRGVLLWLINTHGGPLSGGTLMFWDVEGDNRVGYPAIPLAGYNKETNPWRGYEWLLGSTQEPDTMTSDIHGVLAALTGNPNPRGVRLLPTAIDWAAARRPLRDIIGQIFNLPILRWFAPEWLKDTQDYYDGVIITVLLGRFGTSWYNGSMIDESLGNIHSTGVSSVACLPAGKYLHLTLMRHGSVFQIMDPWATSWYSDVWQNGVPRGVAIGQTIGEIYAEGISKVGILYISEPPQWWWDLSENVCLYGDPNLRIWVPSTEYSTKNHWDPIEVKSLLYNPTDSFYVDGHHPFGAESYPNQLMLLSSSEQYLMLAALIILPALVVIAVILILSRRKK